MKLERCQTYGFAGTALVRKLHSPFTVCFKCALLILLFSVQHNQPNTFILCLLLFVSRGFALLSFSVALCRGCSSSWFAIKDTRFSMTKAMTPTNTTTILLKNDVRSLSLFASLKFDCIFLGEKKLSALSKCRRLFFLMLYFIFDETGHESDDCQSPLLLLRNNMNYFLFSSLLFS